MRVVVLPCRRWLWAKILVAPKVWIEFFKSKHSYRIPAFFKTPVMNSIPGIKYCVLNLVIGLWTTQRDNGGNSWHEVVNCTFRPLSLPPVLITPYPIMHHRSSLQFIHVPAPSSFGTCDQWPRPLGSFIYFPLGWAACVWEMRNSLKFVNLV